MKLIVAGIGFNDLITLRALRAAENSDIILVPRVNDNIQGYAEKFISSFVPNKKYLHINFPMSGNPEKYNAEILAQLEKLAPELRADNIKTIFYPVIGDAMLFSTGEYLSEAVNELFPDTETEYIPGISAHSLAASIAKRFLVMRDEILAIIPGTAPLSKILLALDGCDCAAIYKPSALLDLELLAKDFKPFNFGHIIRVDYAGIPEREKVIFGDKALKNINQYMSIILLWRD